MAVDEASLRTVNDSISAGLIEPMILLEPLIELLSTGTPSITMSGSLEAESEEPARTRIVAPEPGAPEDGVTLTPATLPIKAS